MGSIPELVSTSPYFDLAELVIIPVWQQSDRTHYIQNMTIDFLHRQTALLIDNHPIHRLAGKPRGSGDNIVPLAHETRLPSSICVQLNLQWRGFSQTITLPHFITFKQLWLWLAYFIIRKITHSNCLHETQTPSLLSGSSPHDQFQPTQLVQFISIFTHNGLDIRHLPLTIGQGGNSILLRISCPTRKLPSPRFAPFRTSSDPLHAIRPHPYPNCELDPSSSLHPANQPVAAPRLCLQPQLIPNFTLVELFTNSGRCFPLIIPCDASLSDILPSAEIHTAAPPNLLPFYLGEPCHHRDSPHTHSHWSLQLFH